MDDERAGPKSTRLQRPFGRALCGGTFLAVGPGGTYTVRWHFEPQRCLRSSLKTRRKAPAGLLVARKVVLGKPSPFTSTYPAVRGRAAGLGSRPWRDPSSR